MDENRPVHRIIVIILIAILLVLSFLIVKPILAAGIFGIIGAYIFYPIYSRINSKLKMRNISALIVTFLAILIIIIPIIFALPMMARQTFDIYTSIQNVNLQPVIEKFYSSSAAQGFSQKISISINSFVTKFINGVINNFADILSNLPTVLLNLALMVFVFFFVLRDKEELENYTKSLSPFSPETQKEFSQKSKDITHAVIYGHIVIGVIQGLVTGIGLLIFGVPNVLTLTLISVILAVLPIVGAWLVWLPISLGLIIAGSTGSGIGLLLYGMIVISWVDNILRPVFISWKTNINSALVLVGMIGGFIEFGLLGLIVGPLIVSYLLLILEMYRTKKFDFVFFQNKSSI